VQQLDDAARRARQRARLLEHQAAEVHRVQAVDVLVRQHPLEDTLLVDLAGHRQLHEESGAGRVGVQLVDHRLDGFLRRVGRQFALDGRDPDFGTVAVLARHVGV
jgi:hypothetical protein